MYSLLTLCMNSRGIVTRLNFSDAESSLGTSHLNSLMEDSLGGRASMLGHSQVSINWLHFVYVCVAIMWVFHHLIIYKCALCSYCTVHANLFLYRFVHKSTLV